NEKSNEQQLSEDAPEQPSETPKKRRGRKPSIKLLESDISTPRSSKKAKKPTESPAEPEEPADSWAQCDKCEKWRKLEFPWTKKRFACHQVGVSCEEDCDCDPPCSCNNASKIRPPSGDLDAQPLILDSEQAPSTKPAIIDSPASSGKSDKVKAARTPKTP